MSTLSDGTTTITLPDALMWSDEYAWSAVEQSVSRGLTGSLIVQSGTRVNGRPITLAAVDDSSGWVPRSTVEQVRAWASVAGQTLTLVMRGATRTVLFRHSDGAIQASPVVAYEDDLPTDPYRLTLRFMEI